MPASSNPALSTSGPVSAGLEGIVAGETAVSTITDGLRYRGYAVEELAEHGSFEETAYLLLHGELPTADQLAAFRQRLAAQAVLSLRIVELLRHLPPATPMMDVMRTSASLLAHWDEEVGDNSTAANIRKAERLLAQLPVVMAARARLVDGKEPVPPDAQRSFAENVLWMIHRAEPDPRHVRAMDISLVMYAEHEFNASTFTCRVVAATLSDLHSAIVAGISALKGPLHGGANERVLEVLAEVGTADRAEAWVRDALARKVRIMGFGHRVYKDGDPRARYLKPRCAELAAATGHEDMERIADIIEGIVWQEKKLPPNLDWPSARLYHYLNLPVSLYTPLFVVSRVTGWSAHVIEQHENNRLIRPRSRYVGAAPRPWRPLNARD